MASCSEYSGPEADGLAHKAEDHVEGEPVIVVGNCRPSYPDLIESKRGTYPRLILYLFIPGLKDPASQENILCRPGADR